MYINWNVLLFAFTWSVSKSCIMAKIIVDMHEDAFECQEGIPLPAADVSGLEFDLDENDNLVFNGVVNVTEDYEAPIGMKMYSEHFERGKWTTGLLGRIVKDFCPVILNPAEAWYPITKTLKQTHCPYRKGHIEVFDRVKVGTFGIILPYHMLGEWKLYYEITAKRNDQMIRECVMRRANLSG